VRDIEQRVVDGRWWYKRIVECGVWRIGGCGFPVTPAKGDGKEKGVL